MSIVLSEAAAAVHTAAHRAAGGAVCFVPQEPTRFDRQTGTRRAVIDLTPALRYGRLRICLPPAVSLFATHPVAVALRERMKDFTSEDYLIAVGDPTLIGIAFHIAAQKTGGRFKQLKWDRATSQYLALDISI